VGMHVSKLLIGITMYWIWQVWFDFVSFEETVTHSGMVGNSRSRILSLLALIFPLLSYLCNMVSIHTYFQVWPIFPHHLIHLFGQKR
jgi:hypothetical protein